MPSAAGMNRGSPIFNNQNQNISSVVFNFFYILCAMMQEPDISPNRTEIDALSDREVLLEEEAEPRAPIEDSTQSIQCFGRTVNVPHQLVRWAPSSVQLQALLLGQFLSFLVTITGLTSQLLVTNYNAQLPNTQNFVNYSLLSLYSGVLVWQGRFVKVLRRQYWKYMILAFFDVEGNYLVVLAYQYTNIASVMLLDCWTIPVVMVLSFFFLRARFRVCHYVGVVLCVLGLALLVVSDLLKGETLTSGSKPWLGDLLCIAGATLYGIIDVCQESLVKKFSPIEFLAMIGLFGMVYSGIQMLALESAQLAQLNWDAGSIGLLIGYGASMFCFYSLATRMLIMAGATLLNLSLLTSDFFGVIVQTFLFSDRPTWLYGVALFVIIAGLVIYNMNWKFHSELMPCINDKDDEIEEVDNEVVVKAESPLVSHSVNDRGEDAF